MRLIAIGHLTDIAVPFAYKAIKASTNRISAELLHDDYLDPEEISAFIGLPDSERIVFVAHGSASSVLSASAPRRECFNELQVRSLKNRYVFANCCSTAQTLGKEANAYAYLYLGFADTVAVPPGNADVGERAFVDIYSFILSFIDNINYESPEQMKESVQYFLESVFVRVDEVLAYYERADGTILSADTMLFARDLQFELAAWVRGFDFSFLCNAASKRGMLY